jgi:hypothetical protein
MNGESLAVPRKFASVAGTLCLDVLLHASPASMNNVT